MIGPQNPFSEQLHAQKYRADGETYDDYTVRYARATSDDDGHFRHLLDGLRSMRILPAGRQQRALGTPHRITGMNCFVSATMQDSMDEIMTSLSRAAATLRSGGGIGFNFSPLRPEGEPVRGLGDGAVSSGPISFMSLWDSMCRTIMSGGGRRGAMMGVLNVDHPDIRKFIRAKRVQSDVQPLWDAVAEMPEGPTRQQAILSLQKTLKLTGFNLSVAVTDEFMEAVKADGLFQLRFGGKGYGDVRALDLWSEIMENNWDWAEPGVLFIDRANKMNPLNYCERLDATNPCAEQWLPANGACLLGSLNLVRYLRDTSVSDNVTPLRSRELDFDLIKADVHASVRAYDNVIDRTYYALPEQEIEAKQKRRMGVGVTGLANALETIGYGYGTDGFLREQERVHRFMLNECYRASIELAKEKGTFELFDADGWLASGFAQAGVLDEDVLDGIRKHGLRNGLLTSIAPTGTISMTADNVSSSIEPVYAVTQDRTVNMTEGQVQVELPDYAHAKYGTVPVVADMVHPRDHVRVLCMAQKYTDSAVSKTVNVTGKKAGAKGPGITFDEFKDLYMQAYDGGAKGCTTFNSTGKRMGILASKDTRDEENPDSQPDSKMADLEAAMGAGEACFIDPTTGIKKCE